MKTVFWLLLLFYCLSANAQLNKVRFIDKQVSKIDASLSIFQPDTSELHRPNGSICGFSLDTAFFNDEHLLVKFTRNKHYVTVAGRQDSAKESYYYLSSDLYKVVYDDGKDSVRSYRYTYLNKSRVLKANVPPAQVEIDGMTYLLNSWKRMIQFGKKTKYYY